MGETGGWKDVVMQVGEEGGMAVTGDSVTAKRVGCTVVCVVCLVLSRAELARFGLAWPGSFPAVFARLFRGACEFSSTIPYFTVRLVRSSYLSSRTTSFLDIHEYVRSFEKTSPVRFWLHTIALVGSIRPSVRPSNHPSGCTPQYFTVHSITFRNDDNDVET